MRNIGAAALALISAISLSIPGIANEDDENTRVEILVGTKHGELDRNYAKSIFEGTQCVVVWAKSHRQNRSYARVNGQPVPSSRDVVSLADEIQRHYCPR